LYFNGDTTAANYFKSDYYNEDNAWGLETRITTTTQMSNAPANTAVSNLFGAGEIYIPSYAGTGNQKIAISRLVQSNRDASTSLFSDWNTYLRYTANTNAITEISIVCPNGVWATGSKIDIYGIKNT
jgi:hypothetical protein